MPRPIGIGNNVDQASLAPTLQSKWKEKEAFPFSEPKRWSDSAKFDAFAMLEATNSFIRLADGVDSTNTLETNLK